MKPLGILIEEETAH